MNVGCRGVRTRWGPSWSSRVTPSRRIVVSTSSRTTTSASRQRVVPANSGGGLTINRVPNPFLTIRQSIHKGPTHPHPAGTKTNRLDDVRTTSDPAVNVHLAPAARDDFRVKPVDLEEGIQRGRGTI